MRCSEDEQDAIERVPAQQKPAYMWRPWGLLVVGALFSALIGTWLVWFSIVVQRKLNEEDIRAACHRMMPDTADRCYDTVVIQRGGVRR